MAETRPEAARRFGVALAAVALVGLGIRGAVIATGEPCDLVDFRATEQDDVGCTDLSDASHYVNAARNDAEGRWFTIPVLLGEGDEPTALHPPGYALFLSLPWRLGVEDPTALRVVTSLLGGATIALTGLIARRVAASGTRLGARADTVGLVAAGLVAAHPLAWAVDTSLLSEALFAPLALGALLLALRLVDRPTPRRAIEVGALLGLAAMVRFEALAGVVLVLGPAVLAATRVGTVRLRLLAAGVAATLLVVAPWAIGTYGRFHRPVVLTTTSQLGIRLANCEETYAAGDRFALQAPECVTELNDPEVQRRLGVTPPADPDESDGNALFGEVNRDFIGQNRGRAVVVAAARVGRLWGVYDLPGTVDGFEPIERRGPLRTKVGMVVALGLAVVAAAGARLVRLRRAHLALLLAWPVIASLLAVVDLALVRFRAAADPSICVLAALALVALLPHRRASPSGVGAAGRDD